MNLNTNPLADLLLAKIEKAEIVASVTMWKDDDIVAAAADMRGKAQSNIFIFPSAIEIENTITSGIVVKSEMKRHYSICISAVDPARRKGGSSELNDMLDDLAKLLHCQSLDGKSIILVNRATQVSLDQSENPGRHSWLLDITIQSN